MYTIYVCACGGPQSYVVIVIRTERTLLATCGYTPVANVLVRFSHMHTLRIASCNNLLRYLFHRRQKASDVINALLH